MSIQINILSSSVGAQGVTDYNYNISNQEVIFSFFLGYLIFKCLKRPPKVKNQNFRLCYDFFI